MVSGANGYYQTIWAGNKRLCLSQKKYYKDFVFFFVVWSRISFSKFCSFWFIPSLMCIWWYERRETFFFFFFPNKNKSFTWIYFSSIISTGWQINVNLISQHTLCVWIIWMHFPSEHISMLEFFLPPVPFFQNSQCSVKNDISSVFAN